MIDLTTEDAYVKRVGNLCSDCSVLTASILSDINQVFYGEGLSGNLSATNLSVRYVTGQEYHDLVMGISGTFEPKTVYVISNDTLNFYVALDEKRNINDLQYRHDQWQLETNDGDTAILVKSGNMYVGNSTKYFPQQYALLYAGNDNWQLAAPQFSTYLAKIAAETTYKLVFQRNDITFTVSRGDMIALMSQVITSNDISACMHYYHPNETPEPPHVGDSTFLENTYYIYDGTQWKPCVVVTTPSYIEDSDGNKIESDRDFTQVNIATNWVIDDGVSEHYLSGSKNNASEPTPENPHDGAVIYSLEYNYNIWALSVSIYSASGEQQKITIETCEANEEARELGFAGDITATWQKATTTTGKLATENQLPTKTSELSNDSGFITSADIGNATITLTQGGVTKGTFTTNQLSNQTIDLDAGGGGSSGYTVTVVHHKIEGAGHSGGVTVGGFSVKAALDNLEANNHPCSNPLVLHGIEYMDIPQQAASGLVYLNGTEKNDQFVQLTGDTTVDLYHFYCIAGGTLVSLADGTSKAIEDITYDDDLLVWDFDEGKLSSAKPAWIKRADYVYYSWETKLASGKSIKTCGQHGHRFFDLGTNTWVYADEISGKTVYTLDGADEVVSSQRVDGKVNFYNIITKGHINHFGNGILLGCSLENKLYPVENMRFVKDNRASRPYSEFEGEVPEWWYNECRYAESTASRDYLVKYCKDRLPIMLPK